MKAKSVTPSILFALGYQDARNRWFSVLSENEDRQQDQGIFLTRCIMSGSERKKNSLQ
jgi:hypothetical protein